MDCETYARVRQLFAEALDLPPEERKVFLCRLRQRQEKEEVIEELESLLAFHRESDRAEP